MKKVNIILPAYNGEKYIGEQIESILGQTYGNIDLYIRDDESRDNTKKIIDSYVGKEPSGKKIIVIDNGRENWGYVKNVFETLRLSGEADYYAFCDQDDVWLPEKIEKQIEMLESKTNNSPALCFTEFNYCDSQLNYMRDSVKIPQPLELRNVVYDFIVLNFNIMINKALRDELFQQILDYGAYPHYPDFWMSQVAAGFHGLYCVPEKLVNYRRNENACSSFNQNKLLLLKWRIENILAGDETKKIKRELKKYYECFSYSLNKDDRKLMEMITKPSVIHYFQKIFYPKRFRNTFSDEVALRFLFIMGKL